MKRIKISKIENKMHTLGAHLDQIETLARVLLESMESGENLRYCDTQNLSIILKNKIVALHKDFNKLEFILKI